MKKKNSTIGDMVVEATQPNYLAMAKAMTAKAEALEWKPREMTLEDANTILAEHGENIQELEKEEAIQRVRDEFTPKYKRIRALQLKGLTALAAKELKKTNAEYAQAMRQAKEL